MGRKPLNYYDSNLVYQLSKMRYNVNKNPAKNPPNINDFNFPNFTFSNGKIGLSISCISGVSFLSVIFANSN